MYRQRYRGFESLPLRHLKIPSKRVFLNGSRGSDRTREEGRQNHERNDALASVSGFGRRRLRRRPQGETRMRSKASKQSLPLRHLKIPSKRVFLNGSRGSDRTREEGRQNHERNDALASVSGFGRRRLRRRPQGETRMRSKASKQSLLQDRHYKDSP